MQILIVDDHPIVRNGLKLLIESEAGWNVAGLASNGSDAIRMAGELRPTVAIVDLNLPDISGIYVTEEIRRLSPDTRVVILSMHLNDFYIRAACQKGASAYISKHALESEIIEAVRTVAKGGTYPEDLCRNSGTGLTERSDSALSGRHCEILSSREYQVLHLLASGCQNKEVALQLSISVRTVEKHRANIMQKLNLRNHAELIHFALHNDILKMP